jgi:glyoxylase-like metal-dependent hydrolase (beta-lactamase superfamily II)
MTKADEVEQKRELQEQDLYSQHPGWQSLAKVFDTNEPLFEKVLFLLGYEFSSNIYVITGDYLSIVDAGNDYTAFMHLFKSDTQLASIRKIVLTHGHQDHAMGAFELLRSYPSNVEEGGFELVVHEASSAQLKQMTRDLGCRVTEVKGGETLELSGFEWEVIPTPGHTIDGICLYHAPTKTVFTGDTVLTHAMAEPDKRAGGRLDHYLYAIKELLKRDIENVLPGHGPPVASIGKKVIEKTYEALMLEILGIETQIPWTEGARALAQRGLLEEALFCCDKELARNPESVTSLHLKALCLNDLGRSQEAFETLDKLERLHPERKADPFILIGKGYALMGLEKHQESIKFFDEALKVRPGIKDALVYKGMALYLSGKVDEAMDIEEFRTEFAGRFREEVHKKVQS